ncbi:MAG: hypothetical protein ACRC1W_13290 [Shewanella sp.]
MSKATDTTRATRIEEWVKKYGKGNVIELESDDKSCFIFNPIINLSVMKLAITARRSNAGGMVDTIINNCFIGGDDSCKTDEAFKLGIEEQIDKLIDIPDAKVEREGLKATISIEGQSIEVRVASRADIRYAEDRNKENTALNTQIYLLERTATDKVQIDALKKDNRIYLSVLLAVGELKDKKYVSLKKY